MASMRLVALLAHACWALNPVERWQYERALSGRVKFCGARDGASLAPVFWRWLASDEEPEALACPELGARAAKLEAPMALIVRGTHLQMPCGPQPPGPQP